MTTRLYYYTGPGNSLWVARQLAQRLDVGGVCLHDVGEFLGVARDEGRVRVDAQHLDVEVDQRLGSRRTEAPQPQDDDGARPHFATAGKQPIQQGGPPQGRRSGDVSAAT